MRIALAASLTLLLAAPWARAGAGPAGCPTPSGALPGPSVSPPPPGMSDAFVVSTAARKLDGTYLAFPTVDYGGSPRAWLAGPYYASSSGGGPDGRPQTSAGPQRFKVPSRGADGLYGFVALHYGVVCGASSGQFSGSVRFSDGRSSVESGSIMGTQRFVGALVVYDPANPQRAWTCFKQAWNDYYFFKLRPALDGWGDCQYGPPPAWVELNADSRGVGSGGGLYHYAGLLYDPSRFNPFTASFADLGFRLKTPSGVVAPLGQPPSAGDSLRTAVDGAEMEFVPVSPADPAATRLRSKGVGPVRSLLGN